MQRETLKNQRLHTDEGKDGEEEKKAWAASKDIVDRSVKNGDGGDQRGEDDLSGENTVHLADEAPSELILSGAKPRV